MTYQNEAQNLQLSGSQHSLFTSVISHNFPVTRKNGISGIEISVSETPPQPVQAQTALPSVGLNDVAARIIQMHTQTMPTRFNSHLYGGLCPCSKQYLLPC